MTKRIKIEPELSKRGKWRVRWTQNSKRHVKTFLNKARAVVFCRDLNRGKFPKEEKQVVNAICRKKQPAKIKVVTFRDLAHKFMTNHVMVKTKHSTQRNYEMQLRNQILPVLGDIPVKKLHLRDLDELVAKLASQPRQYGELDRSVVVLRRGKKVSTPKILSPKTQRDCICLALTIMNYCYEREYIDVNPFRKFKLPKIAAARVEYLTGEEVEKFLRWCDAGGPYTGLESGHCNNTERASAVRYTTNINRDTEIFRYALHTGCRLGEILGLRRKALDFENRLIWVSEIYDQSAGEMAKRTKGGNVRCVEMDSVTYDILIQRKDLQPDALVFDNIGQTLWMDRFYIYCNRAGIKRVSFHAFRHTFASTMALYTPPAVLQKILGHASWVTTMKYVHIAQSNVVGYTKYLDGMYKKHRDVKELASLTINQNAS